MKQETEGVAPAWCGFHHHYHHQHTYDKFIFSLFPFIYIQNYVFSLFVFEFSRALPTYLVHVSRMFHVCLCMLHTSYVFRVGFRPNIPFHLVGGPISALSLSFEQKLIYHQSNIVLKYYSASFQRSSYQPPKIVLINWRTYFQRFCYHAKILPNVVNRVQNRKVSIHLSFIIKSRGAPKNFDE